MAYRYSSGRQVVGDLKAQEDAQIDTGIDFSEDQIELHTSGSTRMTVHNGGVHVSGQLTNGPLNYPQSDGQAGAVLKTDGQGNLSFQPAGVIAGNSLTVTPLKNSNYLAAAFEFIPVDIVPGNLQVTLPLANNVGNGALVTVKIAGPANNNTATVAASGSNSIDGDSSFVLDTDYETINLISDGVSKWYIIS
jgi:hypothetical protein